MERSCIKTSPERGLFCVSGQHLTSFATVSADSFYPGTRGLQEQSTRAWWWHSSPASMTSASDASATRNGTTFGTAGNTKFHGFSLRCVYP
ncbi:hypothetical protein FWH13_03270 [Candidatus Saccharibacteria bacterium]|nr:hypothetical protein [Candidatus Saccharibacteria bacterium]